jgi:hypothetical protein
VPFLPYALFNRYDERLALGYVTARLVECGFIALGIVSVRSIVTCATTRPASPTARSSASVNRSSPSTTRPSAGNRGADARRPSTGGRRTRNGPVGGPFAALL